MIFLRKHKPPLVQENLFQGCQPHIPQCSPLRISCIPFLLFLPTLWSPRICSSLILPPQPPLLLSSRELTFCLYWVPCWRTPSSSPTPNDFNSQHFLGDKGQFKKSNAFVPFSIGKRPLLTPTGLTLPGSPLWSIGLDLFLQLGTCFGVYLLANQVQFPCGLRLKERHDQTPFWDRKKKDSHRQVLVGDRRTTIFENLVVRGALDSSLCQSVLDHFPSCTRVWRLREVPQAVLQALLPGESRR